MTKNELIAKLEGAKEVTSVVSIDLMLAALGMLEEPKANKSEQVEWLDKAWWIAPKQKMDIMGLEIPDYIDQTEMEKLYIPSSLQSPDEFQPLTLPE